MVVLRCSKLRQPSRRHPRSSPRQNLCFFYPIFILVEDWKSNTGRRGWRSSRLSGPAAARHRGQPMRGWASGGRWRGAHESKRQQLSAHVFGCVSAAPMWWGSAAPFLHKGPRGVSAPTDGLQLFMPRHAVRER